MATASGDRTVRAAPKASFNPPESTLAAGVHNVLGQPGMPLEPASRMQFEQRLGHDFSGVRVHTDPQAAASASSIEAQAYTVGEHVVFGADRYRPDTAPGRDLLGHELVHVVQQSAAKPAGEPLTIGGCHSDACESEASTSAAPPKARLETQALQRASFWQKLTRFFGAEGTFSDEELQTYLRFLDSENRIEDNFDSDNKAREVVRRWQANRPGYVLSVARKVLLLREFISGATLDGDERAMIAILSGSTSSELDEIFRQVPPEEMRAEIDGSNRVEFDLLIDVHSLGDMDPTGERPSCTGGSPRDRMIVERARRRLPVLRQFMDEWAARQARELEAAQERDPLLQARTRMDAEAGESGADLMEAITPGVRQRMERENILNLNRRPLTIDLTDAAVTFRVQFHARFEDSAMRGRFSELERTLLAGIRLVWNQRLRGRLLGGRDFRVEPNLALVATDAPRDQGYWLITVRPTDTSPMVYPGCRLPTNNSGIPTSVTDAQCDGGVVSIPPAHIGNAGVLGHELMHLFGLVDRYLNTVSQVPGQPPVNRNYPTRETGGRVDPLGAQDGPILAEDLVFLFDRLGVYEQESNRGFEVLRRLESQGMTMSTVVAEIHRLEEIIRLGCDPGSLIRTRRDFNDRMIRNAEDL